jgi:hypothetical protein
VGVRVMRTVLETSLPRGSTPGSSRREAMIRVTFRRDSETHRHREPSTSANRATDARAGWRRLLNHLRLMRDVREKSMRSRIACK